MINRACATLDCRLNTEAACAGSGRLWGCWVMAICVICLMAGPGFVVAEEAAPTSEKPDAHKQAPKPLAELQIVPNSYGMLVNIHWPDAENRFVLHTGSSVTVISRRFRSELGKRLGGINSFTSLGESVVDYFDAPAFRVGDCELRSKRAICMSLESIAQNAGHDVAGFIGLDAIEQHVIRLDLSGGWIKIFDRLPSEVTDEWQSIDMVRVPRGWKVPAALGDAGREKTERFILNTGSPVSIELRDSMFDRLLKSGMLDRFEGATLVSVDGELATTTARLGRFRIGRFEHERISVGLASDDSELGIGYLRRYIAVFDFPNKKLFLLPSRDYQAPDPASDESGLHLVWQDGKIVVQTCLEGSPAELAGFQASDQLKKVDGRPVSELSLCTIRELLAQKNKVVRFEAVREGRAVVSELRLGNSEHAIESHEIGE